jgi:hypothetical protein
MQPEMDALRATSAAAWLPLKHRTLGCHCGGPVPQRAWRPEFAPDFTAACGFDDLARFGPESPSSARRAILTVDVYFRGKPRVAQ